MKKTAKAQQTAEPRPADHQYKLGSKSCDNVLVENNTTKALNEKSLLAYRLITGLSAAKNPKEIESTKCQVVGLFKPELESKAKKYNDPAYYDDYFDVGWLAFYDAIDTFSPDKNAYYYIYAAACAGNAMQDLNKKIHNGGYLSDYKVDQFRHISNWESSHGIINSDWSPEDVAIYATSHGTTPEHVLDLLAEKFNLQNPLYLDQEIGTEGPDEIPVTYGDFIEATGTTPVRFVEDGEFKDAMWETVDLLSDLDYKILFLRTGLYDGEKKSFREIAENTGLSEYKVTQVYTDVIIYLSDSLEKRGYTYDIICYE